ncbi:Formin-like protein [Hirschfeldia incana]|nr:Formin-like protein [Hirschfeldia incana]
MASGRVNSGFDFGSDDILRTYDDFTNQDSSNGSNSDPAIASTNFNKEFHKTRMARSSVLPTSSYSPPEDSLSQEITATVERTMKKYTDNVMRFLEGISSRLSQLELYCYNLDKTIGEMRSDLTRDNEEADVKLRSMEKHLQEVRRSVQILRDKQELADTQKDLARLQVVHKDSSSPSHSQQSEEPPVAEPKKSENTSDSHNQQLALALPHQIPPQPQPQQQQQQQYYMPPAPQLQNTPAPVPVPAPQSQPQAPPAQAQFMPPPPAPSQHPSSAQTQSFPQYQQNWPPQQQARPQSSGGYPSYSPAPPSNQSPVEPLPSSMQMPSPYAGPPQQSMQGYGYGAPPPPQPQAPQQTKMSYNPQAGDGYLPSGPPPPPGYANAMYEGGRMQYPPTQPPPPQQQGHYMQGPQGGGYAPQQHQGGGGNTGTPQPVLRSKYGELIEKLVSMGFRGDHVMSVIQRMEESGQPIDFNALLDRLSVQSSGGPPRGW